LGARTTKADGQGGFPRRWRLKSAAHRIVHPWHPWLLLSRRCAGWLDQHGLAPRVLNDPQSMQRMAAPRVARRLLLWGFTGMILHARHGGFNVQGALGRLSLFRFSQRDRRWRVIENLNREEAVGARPLARVCVPSSVVQP
jgi:hypothetical protein